MLSVFYKRMADNVRIVKVGGTAATPKPAPPPAKKHHKKSMRTFPRGVLKKGGKTERAKVHVEGVRDPSKPPPVRKSTIRILTDKGASNRRDHIRKTVRNMPIEKVRQVLKASGIPISSKTPEPLAKEILEGGMEAGMIVSD
jgi:hypothetical protein